MGPYWWRLWLLLLLGVIALAWACAALERDSMIYYTWSKRGQAAGNLIHLYCDQGSHQERMVFQHSLGMASHGATVTIHCPEPGPLFAPAPKP